MFKNIPQKGWSTCRRGGWAWGGDVSTPAHSLCDSTILSMMCGKDWVTQAHQPKHPSSYGAVNYSSTTNTSKATLQAGVQPKPPFHSLSGYWAACFNHPGPRAPPRSRMWPLKPLGVSPLLYMRVSLRILQPVFCWYTFYLHRIWCRLSFSDILYFYHLVSVSGAQIKWSTGN